MSGKWISVSGKGQGFFFLAPGQPVTRDFRSDLDKIIGGAKIEGLK